MSTLLSHGQEAGGQHSLREYWRMVRKRKRLAITFFLIAVSSTAFYSLSQPKMYKATTRIVIEKGTKNILSFDSIFPVQTSGHDYYPTQHKMLMSRTIGRAVIEELQLDSKYQWARDPVGAFLRQVEVTRVKGSRLFDVSAYSTDPQEAADIANAMVDNYIDQNLENKLTMTHQASVWLENKIAKLWERLSNSERELQAFKEDHPAVDFSALDVSESMVGKLESELASLRVEFSALNERYLPKHPEVIRAKSRITTIEGQLSGRRTGGLVFGRIAIEYNRLKREVDSNRTIYDTMLKRLKETVASEGMEDTNVFVVDAAEVPTSPVGPRVLLNIILGLMVGAFGGVGLCLVFESLDVTIKSPEDVERNSDLALLGVIGRWDHKREEIIVEQRRFSGIAEAFRAIRTSLLFSSPDRPLRTLLITSPDSGDGKTAIAANLAVTIAQSGARVLLVDADMRKPRAHRVLGVDHGKGLSESLMDPTNTSDFAQKTAYENLWVLTSGVIPPTPSELLGSKRMKELADRLRDQYDYVIFDSPPFRAVTDPVVLSTVVDGVILVTRYQKSPKAVLKASERTFSEVRARLVGVIINAVALQLEADRYSSYSYYASAYSKNPDPVPAELLDSSKKS